MRSTNLQVPISKPHFIPAASLLLDLVCSTSWQSPDRLPWQWSYPPQSTLYFADRARFFKCKYDLTWSPTTFKTLPKLLSITHKLLHHVVLLCSVSCLICLHPSPHHPPPTTPAQYSLYMPLSLMSLYFSKCHFLVLECPNSCPHQAPSCLPREFKIILP